MRVTISAVPAVLLVPLIGLVHLHNEKREIRFLPEETRTHGNGTGVELHEQRRYIDPRDERRSQAAPKQMPRKDVETVK